MRFDLHGATSPRRPGDLDVTLLTFGAPPKAPAPSAARPYTRKLDRCGHAEGYTEVMTRGLRQCKRCRRQTALTGERTLAPCPPPGAVRWLAEAHW